MATKPPAPDQLPGPVKYQPPTGKPEDHPLERIHQEHRAHKAQRGAKAARKGRLGAS